MVTLIIFLILIIAMTVRIEGVAIYGDAGIMAEILLDLFVYVACVVWHGAVRLTASVDILWDMALELSGRGLRFARDAAVELWSGLRAFDAYLGWRVSVWLIWPAARHVRARGAFYLRWRLCADSAEGAGFSLIAGVHLHGAARFRSGWNIRFSLWIARD